MTGPMTKGEREDLQRLIRQREKALKGAAKQRSAELLADFENQMGQEYAFDQDSVWAEAAEYAQKAVAAAQEQVAKRCVELGIPREFAPSLTVHWSARGYGNTVEQRKRELRTMAKRKIEALEAAAIVKIEMHSVETQTKVAMNGMTSDAAKFFIESLPSVESLMPVMALADVRGKPPAQQLLAPSFEQVGADGYTAISDQSGPA